MQQHSPEIGGNSIVNSEQEASVASDTDKDISSIVSEVDEEQLPPAQQVRFAAWYHNIDFTSKSMKLHKVNPDRLTPIGLELISW